MSIEVPPDELYALADRLRAQGAEAAEVTDRLRGVPGVGGPLGPGADAFLLAHRVAADALAGELRWLGSAVTAVADSWLGLDGSVLGAPNHPVPR
jgi:hypothetical protein